MYLLLQFSFNRFEIIQGSSIGYKHYGLCFFLTIKINFEFLANFRNFRNNGIIYINCKMYLLLQFLFNRFEIIQGSSIGYEHDGSCFFDDRINFEFLANF